MESAFLRSSNLLNTRVVFPRDLEQIFTLVLNFLNAWVRAEKS